MSLLEQFCQEMKPLLKGKDSVHGAVSVCASYEEAGRQIAQLLWERRLQRVIAAARPELDPALNSLQETLARLEVDGSGGQSIALRREIETESKLGDSSFTFREYAEYDAGIGGADVLIAESATLGLKKRRSSRISPSVNCRYWIMSTVVIPPGKLPMTCTSVMKQCVHI